MPERSERRLQLALGVFFVAATLLFTSADTPGGDALYYWATTDALARFGTLDSREVGIPLEATRTLVRDDGARYTIFPLGQSLAQLPAYWLGLKGAAATADPQLATLAQILGLRLTPALLTALAGVLLFRLARRLDFGVWLSTLLAIAYVFATMAFPYSKSNYSEPLQAVLVLAILLQAVSPRTVWSLPTLSLAYAGLVLAKPVYAVLAPSVVYIAWANDLLRRPRLASSIGAVGVAMLCGGLFFYWNYIRTGSPFDTYGPFQQVETVFVPTNLPLALYHLLLSPYKNLFLYNPVLLLAIPGFFWLGSSAYRRAWAVIVLPSALLFGMFHLPGWGTVAWGPRFLMPFLAACMPFAGATLQRVSTLRPGTRRLAATAIALLLAASVYVQILGSSYSWFHVKHLCTTYAAYQGRAALPVCNGDDWLSSAVAIHHYLFRNASFERAQRGDLPEFPWIETPLTPTLSSQILGRATQRWIAKDYLFVNGDTFFPGTNAVPWIAAILTIIALGSLGIGAATLVHSERPVASQPTGSPAVKGKSRAGKSRARRR